MARAKFQKAMGDSRKTEQRQLTVERSSGRILQMHALLSARHFPAVCGRNFRSAHAFFPRGSLRLGLILQRVTQRKFLTFEGVLQRVQAKEIVGAAKAARGRLPLSSCSLDPRAPEQ